jgi:hypothetical protein
MRKFERRPTLETVPVIFENWQRRKSMASEARRGVGISGSLQDTTAGRNARSKNNMIRGLILRRRWCGRNH